jgi:signal transduction histidine kinase
MDQIVTHGLGIFLYLLLPADIFAQDIIPQNQPAPPPQVRITHLRRFDQNVPLAPFAQNLTVRQYDNYLEIGFTVVDSLAPEKPLYRYRLAGIDTGWVETKQRFVQYKNLDTGNYAFAVKARHATGDWSEPAQIDFVLEPPFWERLWFALLIALVTVGSAVYFITFRVRQLLAIERLRTRIAADLHDNIGAGLTEISILSDVGAKTLGQHPQNGSADHFDKIGHVARALVDRMNDIVWLVNPKRDSLYDLIQQLGSSFEEVSTCAGIIFRAHNLEILRKVHLPMEYRQQLYYIFKEALHNSLKHSAAKEIVLEACLQGKRLAMQLQDDGKGFDQTQISPRNGLKNMKSRAAMIGGVLAIHSTSGDGTVVEFSGKVSWA